MRFLPDDEGLILWRAKPSQSYRRPETVLWLPKAALQMTVSALQVYRRLEGACYWYGLRDGADNGFVKAVVVPLQVNTWGNYHVRVESVSAMSAATRSFGWVCLSQVHSHPGSLVEHSSYDDEHASSQRILSVVFPHYARWHADWPKGIGIHECQNGYWHQLSEKDAAFRVQLEVGTTEVAFIDLRK